MSGCIELPGEKIDESYVVVGAGVFGASAALELKRAKPWARVTLMDRTPYPNPAAASFDLNKIIRADYRDVFYMKLALQALAAWKTDPLYKPYYHETGMLFAENAGKAQDFLLNYALLGHDSKAQLMDVHEVHRQFPCFKEANLAGVKRAYFSPHSGWGEAVGALCSVIDAAIDLGVVYREASVERILLDAPSDGGLTIKTCLRRCTGIQTTSGDIIEADHVVLCTGAATAQLLANSSPNDASLQVAGRLVAAAALSCMVRVDPEKWHLYRDAPVFANLMPHTAGEAIPLTPDGYIKVNHELSFTNMLPHAASRQVFSTPPEALKHCCWTNDVPDGLKAEALKVVVHTYGPSLDGMELESFRLCWDAITPNQDWIISPHDNCLGLSIATGGSFHGWKFLPVLGREIVSMLDGTLSDEKTARWAWTRHDAITSGACESYFPKRDLKEIVLPDTIKARV